MYSQGLSSTLAGLSKTTPEPGRSFKGETQHLGPARAESAGVLQSHVRERRAQQKKGRVVWVRLSEAWGATKCYRGCIVHTTMMSRAIEKPLQAPWGYLFPQTHGNCLLGTICHPPKLLLFTSYSQLEMLHGNLHETASSFQLDVYDTMGTTMGWYNSECTWHSYKHPIFFSDLA